MEHRIYEEADSLTNRSIPHKREKKVCKVHEVTDLSTYTHIHSLAYYACKSDHKLLYFCNKYKR